MLQEAAAAFAGVQAALQSQLDGGSLASNLAPAAETPTASSMVDLLTAAKEEQAAFEGMLRDVSSLLTASSDTWMEQTHPADVSHPADQGNADQAVDAKPVPTYVIMLWELGRLRRSLAVLVMTWAATLHDPVVYARPISHSHSVPNSLHSLQESGRSRHLSTESLPELHIAHAADSGALPGEQADPHEGGCEPQHAAANDLHGHGGIMDDTPHNDAHSTIDSCDSPTAQQPDPTIMTAQETAQKEGSSEGHDNSTGEDPAGNKPARTASLPAVSRGIVAQTIRQLERRESERATPTRLNAAAAARRYLASALQQRARTLQWLDSSKLSADEARLVA